jgi:hypothetical protein
MEQQEQSRWEYVPGLLDLMEQGIGAQDLAGREFIAPQVRSVSHAAEQLLPAERSRLERIWDWLKGFRRESTLCERHPIWVPIAEIWAAPSGSAEFAYKVDSQQESQAEMTVFSLAGFGGGSRRQLTTAVRISASSSGAAYDIRAFLTVHRYANQNTGEEMYSVNVDCTGEFGEYRSHDVEIGEHPLYGSPTDVSQLRDAGYTVSRIERCAGRSGNTEVTLRDETLRSWKFSVSPGLPMLHTSLKLGATCQRTKAFESKFVLPGGHDYAFCAARGEAPIVPLCVPLAAQE